MEEPKFHVPGPTKWLSQDSNERYGYTKNMYSAVYGSFEFLVIPFRLANAPSTFQDLMNNLLREYLDEFLMVYIDDILILSRTEEDHFPHIELSSK
jgi:hypothetical protein